MNNTVISVRNLSKKYRLGATLSPDTLRDHIMHVFGRLGKRNEPEKKLTRDFWALKDVSFDVSQGEVLGVIGPNGAGKSTLLKILTGITEPTEGEVRIRGRVASLLEVGTGFHLELSGRENIFMNGAILGMNQREIKAKFDEIVDFAGVEKFLDTPVKRYSSGMRVRLGFAVAAHLEPEILLIDEVLAVGDAEFQAKCLGKMEGVANSGRTVLFVSHNLAAVENLCPNSILLCHGRLTQNGASPDIIATYLSSTIQSTDKPEYIADADARGVIRRVAIRNSKGEIQNPLRMGRPCEFEIELQFPDVQQKIAVGLHLKTRSGQRVTSFHTSYHPLRRQFPQQKELRLKCSCTELMLAEGHYVLEVAVGYSQKSIERLESAVIFQIAESNIFDTGKHPPSKDGLLISKAFWDVSDD